MSNRKRCTVSNLEVGEYVSRRQYLKVESKESDKVNFETQSKFEFYASNDIVEESMYTPNQFSKVVTTSRTELAQKLMESNGDIFTVNFDKQATEETVTAKLENATVGDLTTPSKRKALAKSLKIGEQRTLIGYLLAPEPILGRSKVVDLEQEFDGKPSSRLVDHRTINWLILANVKYVLK